MMIVGLVGVFALGALVLAGGAAAGQTPSADEPESYRSENYRSQTPATLRGARVVSTIEAQAIWSEGSATFIDVLPNFPPPPDLSAGTLWRGQQRGDRDDHSAVAQKNWLAKLKIPVPQGQWLTLECGEGEIGTPEEIEQGPGIE